jgi:hypothetical protein
MKNYLFKIACSFWIIASISISCKSVQEESVAPLVKADFKGEILGNVITLRLDENNIIGNPSISFVTPDVFGYPTEVRLGSTLQNNDYYISLTAPKIKYAEYSFQTMQKLLSTGSKKIGTESLQADINQFGDSFIFVFSSKKLFNSNKAFISKGMEGQSLEIVEAKEIVGESGYERGIQIIAKINCKLYNGEKYEGDLKDGVLTLKYLYKPFTR